MKTRSGIVTKLPAKYEGNIRRQSRLDDIQYFWVNHELQRIEPCELLKWAEQFGERDHFVRQTTVANGKIRVSTICLGFDIGCGMWGEPQLFESAILWGDLGPNRDLLEPIKVQGRYSTWEQAIEGHERLVFELVLRYGGWLTYQK
jgi:hypothetical protein